MTSELEKDSMDIDRPGGSNASPCGPHGNGLTLYPVSVNDSGEGLPYAPEDFPNPGDKWRWKVGKRIAISGYFLDRYMYLPRRLRQPGHRKGLASRLSLRQYVREKFPNTDIDRFFASFSWKIPSKRMEKGDKEMFSLPGETLEDNGEPRCKAGNKFCSSLASQEDSTVSQVMFCDICCIEPGFCIDCCCILCCRVIDKASSDDSYIRCEANVEGPTCGHSCHIDCALRAYMAGTVGGSIGLDAEYYCRRCDSKTDLVSYVERLLENCESVASRDGIEKILRVGIRVLRGSKKASANELLHHIELAMSKLKDGTYLEDIWKEEDVSADIADNLLKGAVAPPRVPIRASANVPKTSSGIGVPAPAGRTSSRQRDLPHNETTTQSDSDTSPQADNCPAKRPSDLPISRSAKKRPEADSLPPGPISSLIKCNQTELFHPFMMSAIPEADKTLMNEYTLESGLNYVAKHLCKAFAALGPCIFEACKPELRTAVDELKAQLAEATQTISEQKTALSKTQELLDVTKAEAESSYAEIRQLRKEIKHSEVRYAELVSKSKIDRSAAYAEGVLKGHRTFLLTPTGGAFLSAYRTELMRCYRSSMAFLLELVPAAREYFDFALAKANEQIAQPGFSGTLDADAALVGVPTPSCWQGDLKEPTDFPWWEPALSGAVLEGGLTLDLDLPLPSS